MSADKSVANAGFSDDLAKDCLPMYPSDGSILFDERRVCYPRLSKALQILPNVTLEPVIGSV